MNLEETLEKLESIAERLEDAETTLDESLSLFDEGAKLAESCLKMLSEGKGKLALIKEKFDKITEESLNEEEF